MLDIRYKNRYNGKVEFFIICLTKDNPHFQFIIGGREINNG